ncbi:hypothetical protein ACS0TY_010415 [Phlomoides rotata]
MYPDYDANFDITFLNCLSPVTNPLYVQNPFCGNTSAFSNSSRVYSYVTVGRIVASDLVESCTYDSMVEASAPWPLGDHNYSYSQIHDMLAYGFQLTWFQAMCTECEERKRSCSLEGDKIVCSHSCDEHTPLSEQDFICTLEYYGPYLFYAALAIGAIIALRFIVGIPCILGLLMKISDSGLSRLYSSDHKSEGVVKMGFIPPELWYKNVGEISCKADVYSYGMVVLEMGANLESLNPYADKAAGGIYFPLWIYKQLSEGMELEMGDAEEKEMVKKNDGSRLMVHSD